MGFRVTPLRTYRRDLASHLAARMDAVPISQGRQVNPPAVIVSPGSTYVVAETYCDDAISFAVAIVAPPGDPEGVFDALDDMVDQVRGTLRSPSPSGVRYKFVEVSGLTGYTIGDTDYPAVIASVLLTRQST